MSAKPIRILLVDDDEDDYLIIRGLLAMIPRTPFCVEWARHYDKAMRTIARSKHDIYLIDYRLGEKSGLDLLAAAHAETRPEPFLLLTGAGDERVEQEAMNLGAADYLVKGRFDVDLLSRVLRYSLQRKAMEGQRLQHLIAINKAKDEFISLASHQLRTPATGVKQYIGMLLEGYSDEISPAQRVLLAEAYTSNERQLQIINDLLKVARLDAGKVQLNKQKTDLGVMLQNILKEQRSTFAAHMQLVTFLKPMHPVISEVDALHFRMVLENIIDNASKYSQANTTITITLSEEVNIVKIRIQDEGVGIDRLDFDKLFQKFSRIDNALSVTVGGSGLGLYWARKVIDLHAGSIAVASKLGHGATFTISIPKVGRILGEILS